MSARALPGWVVDARSRECVVSCALCGGAYRLTRRRVREHAIHGTQPTCRLCRPSNGSVPQRVLYEAQLWALNVVVTLPPADLDALAFAFEHPAR